MIWDGLSDVRHVLPQVSFQVTLDRDRARRLEENDAFLETMLSAIEVQIPDF